MTIPRNTVLFGHVLDRIREIPDGSVQCVVTSPPYWGLRDYGADPVVWDGDVDCEHEWTDEIVRGGSAGAQGATGQMATRAVVDARTGAMASHGRSCAKCGAWLGQLGLEPTPDLYVRHMVAVFREVRRVLRDDGTLWLNLGDSYSRTKGKFFNDNWDDLQWSNRQSVSVCDLPPKNLMGMPWRVAFALQEDGWILRCDIIWAKNNPLPESVQDRPTRAHEYVFLFSKQGRYFYDNAAIREPLAAPNDNTPDDWARAYSRKRSSAAVVTQGELKPKTSGNKERVLRNDRDGLDDHFGASVPWTDNGSGRNARTVWTIPTQPFKGSHFATFPEELARRCILAGSPERCCAACGKPHARTFATTDITKKSPASWNTEKGAHTGIEGRYEKRDLECVVKVPAGFAPTCSCDSAIGRPIVFDPFMGSGTVARVAERHNRDWLGVEIQPKYAPLQAARTSNVQKEIAL